MGKVKNALIEQQESAMLDADWEFDSQAFAKTMEACNSVSDLYNAFGCQGLYQNIRGVNEYELVSRGY